SPLYLCISDHGSVCLDFGPGSCLSCHESHDHGDGGACEHKHGAPLPCVPQQFATSGNSPCDCLHVRLLSRGESISAKTVAPDDWTRYLSFVATVGDVSPAATLSASAPPHVTFSFSGLAPSLALIERASVVLRC